LLRSFFTAGLLRNCKDAPEPGLPKITRELELCTSGGATCHPTSHENRKTALSLVTNFLFAKYPKLPFISVSIPFAEASKISSEVTGLSVLSSSMKRCVFVVVLRQAVAYSGTIDAVVNNAGYPR
jgi:hypothetical protein